MKNDFLIKLIKDDILRSISEKVISSQRITTEEALYLYENASISVLGLLSNFVREKLHGDNTYFIKNIHIEPTNICIYECKFCSYARKIGDKTAWNYSLEDIRKKIEDYRYSDISEVHVVGGVHPDYTIEFYAEILRLIRSMMPKVHIKAFTAVEIDYVINKSKMSLKDGLLYLKNNGLCSLPGGGAELFDTRIREEICPNKASSERWLEIHRTAHTIGIPSNVTMLYGLNETKQIRLQHLEKIREMQDVTNGFNAFIPLKFRAKNNSLSHLAESSVIDDLKTFAISRIYLDNIQHIKAYWVMLGKELSELTLSFGSDDIDGTIEDSTKIYEMAGVTHDHNSMTVSSLKTMIESAKRQAYERDSLYNIIKKI